MLQVWQDKSHVKRSKETSSFEAGDELAETGCIEMASVDLNALEIAAVQLLEKDHRIRIGISWCAAVTVFPKSVADDYPMLDMPGKAMSYRPASGKLLPDLGARKVQVKLRDGSLRYVTPRFADTHRAMMTVSEMNDMGHDVFFPRSDRGIKAYAYHESSGTKLELERVNGVFELPVELVPHTQSTSKKSTSGSYSSLSALEQIRDMMVRAMIVDHQTDRGVRCSKSHGKALLQTLSAGGSSGSRDVIYPIPGGGLLGDRPVVPGGRERTEREEQWKRQIEGDTAQGPGCEGQPSTWASSAASWWLVRQAGA